MSVSSVSGTSGLEPVLPAVVSGHDTAPAPAPAGVGIQSPSVLASLTPSDRSLIAAATGVVISPEGDVLSGGGFASSGAVAAANQFAVVIAAARDLGQLQGRITPQDLANLFPPYTSFGANGADPRQLAAAADYLAGSGPSAAAPASSGSTASETSPAVTSGFDALA